MTSREFALQEVFMRHAFQEELYVDLRGTAQRAVHRSVATADADREQTLRHARDMFDQLRLDYGAFEMNPASLLDRPALADVSDPLTAAFHTALARAQHLASRSA